jgi:hypothetical protein
MPARFVREYRQVNGAQIPSYMPVCLFVLDGIRLYDQAHAPLPVTVKRLHVSSCWNVTESARSS